MKQLKAYNQVGQDVMLGVTDKHVDENQCKCQYIKQSNQPCSGCRYINVEKERINYLVSFTGNFSIKTAQTYCK